MRKQRTPKFYALCGAIGLLAVGSASNSWAANLLINPRMESPTASDPNDPNVSTVINGWSFVGDTARSKFHGSHDAGGIWNVWLKTFVDQTGGVEQVVTVQPSSQYTLSAWNWFESASITTDSIVRMQMTWLDSGGSPTGSPAIFTLDPTAEPPFPAVDQWIQNSLQATSPATAASARIFLGYDFGGAVPGPQSIFFDDAIFDGPGNPPSSAQWVFNGSGDWNVAGNWADGTVPNGVGAQADFLGVITGPQTVFTNTAITVGTLNFNNANTYVLTGAGTLTLQAAAGNAFVNVNAGTQKINLPLTIASSTTFNVAGGATLKISDPMTINTGRTVSQTGAGLVIYESIVNVQGQAGLIMGNTTHMAALNIANQGTASLAANGSRVLKTDALNITAGGKLDLNNNDMIVVNGNYSTIRSQIASGRNGGSWNGTGITSSAAGAANPRNTTLGILTGAQFAQANGPSALFDGFSVTAGNVLVKYTYYGDTDFNGLVNFDDYARIDNGFATGGNEWFEGDFDHNANVNFDDYSLIDLAFNTQSGTLIRAMDFLEGEDRNYATMNTPELQMVVDHFAQFGNGYANSFLNAVPEPGTALLLAGLPALAGMRRRRNGRA